VEALTWILLGVIGVLLTMLGVVVVKEARETNKKLKRESGK